MRVPLFFAPPGSTLPHIRTALSTTLPPPGLNLSLNPGSHGQFARSAPLSLSHQASPVPFGHFSRLTDAANAAAASREQSQQAALVPPLARLLLKMPACSPLASSQLPSNPSFVRVADPDQLRPNFPPRTHRRTCSLSQSQSLCPNFPRELHLPSRRPAK